MPRAVILLFFILWVPVPGFAIDTGPGKVLPMTACAEGWIMEGKVTFYDRDNLFERVNGEAEFYLPYGFDLLAYARYANRGNAEIAIDADVYRMGSLVDAFGTFASFRRADDSEVKIGAGGTVSSAQLFFYQGRYFVRLQATGTTKISRDILVACARAIARNLPGTSDRPGELEAYRVPAVTPRSEHYVAQSLLGYEFFRRGFTADATVGGGQVQLFLVPEDSREAARSVFDRYRSYLEASGKEVRLVTTRDRISLRSVDPLYGNVIALCAGQFIVGAIRVKDAAAVQPLVEQVLKRLENRYERREK